MPNAKKVIMSAGAGEREGYQLFTWGSDAGGALAAGTSYTNTARNRSPTIVGDLETWTDLYMETSIGKGVDTDGKLWSWGRNHAGQIGDNSVIYRSSPVQVGSDVDWYDSTLGGGGWAPCVAKSNGTMWTWGYNIAGTTGQGNVISLSTPTQLGSLTNWGQVSGNASNHLVAVKTDGTMWSWGDNRFGACGLETPIAAISSPIQIGSLTTWAQASAGVQFAAAIKTDGTLWTWGRSPNGESGTGRVTGGGFSGENVSSPTQVGSLTDWAKVSCGNKHVACIKTDGTLWTWGDALGGAKGDGEGNLDRSSPIQVGSLTDWADVNAGNNICLALKTDGTMWSWGAAADNVGGTGQGDLINLSSPVQVGSLTTWLDVNMGQTTAAALREA